MVEFEVAVKEIYHLEHPELNDAFAQSLGQKDFATLKELISGNLKSEKEVEETQRQEKEVLEKIAKESSFEEIPDLLLNQEINKMIEELQRGVEEQGGEFETYLKSIKRTMADLKIDFTPQALMRVKVGLVLREVAKRAEIKVSEEEIDAQLDRMAERYDDNEDAKKRLYSPEYREYAQAMLTNRKTIAHLVETMVK
jgi:trigger factor